MSFANHQLIATASALCGQGESCGADLVRHLEYPHHVVVAERQSRAMDLDSELVGRFPYGTPPIFRAFGLSTHAGAL